MLGPQIIARTLTQPDNVRDRFGNGWQYFSRSDHHSKTMCWAFLFDLLLECSLLRQHVASKAVAFGINHTMRDFAQDKPKDLDLVLCRPQVGKKSSKTFSGLAEAYRLNLTAAERALLEDLPILEEMPVGNVLVALEAKAAMTSHVKACPRLYDELNSSHQIVHGDTSTAIAAGLVMINVADNFVSPDSNKMNLGTSPAVKSVHRQPKDAERVYERVQTLPRRAHTGDRGFDGIAVLMIDCPNDGRPVKLIESPPAPVPGESWSYESLVSRTAHLYRSRNPQI